MQKTSIIIEDKMEKHNEHIANIEKLEDEIRKLAVPYVSEEPDPLYWANFRVRVMDQVGKKEAKAGLLDSIQQFLAGHIWGSSIAVSAAALLVAGVIVFSPFGGDAPLKQSVSAPVAVTQPAAPVQAAKPDLAVVQEKPAARMTFPSHESYASNHAKVSQPDLASVEPLLSSDDDHPVSLDELSTPELEAIVQDLENNE
jgi:anti-sigma-K factor RskA